MDATSSIAGADKVEKWRFDEVLRMWPQMNPDHASELAFGPDGKLLEKAKKMFDGGCSAELAYRILS